MDYWQNYRNRLRRDLTWRSLVETFLLILAIQIVSWWIGYMGAPGWLSFPAGLIIVLGAVILAKRSSR